VNRFVLRVMNATCNGHLIWMRSSIDLFGMSCNNSLMTYIPLFFCGVGRRINNYNIRNIGFSSVSAIDFVMFVCSDGITDAPTSTINKETLL